MDLSGFELSGYQPILGLPVIILLMITGVVLAIFTYWHYRDLSRSTIVFLIISRSLVFILLLLLLLNPVLNKNSITESRQKIAILIDNSASIDIHKGNWNGKEDLIELLNRLSSDDIEYELILYSIDSDADRINSFQDLTYDAAVSNLYESLRSVITNGEYGQIVLITDGISTQGREVVYAIMDDKLPVHTIAIGDTTRVNDIILQNIDYPRNTSINTSYTINTTIRNDGFPDQTIAIVLKKNGVIQDRKTVRTTQTRSIHQVQFDVLNEEEGTYNYSIEIEPVQGEWSTENNNRNFSIQADDEKTSILYLSFELHPDVGAIKSILQQNASIELDERVWLTGNNFIQGSIPGPSETYDLVIVHGLPVTTDRVLSDRVNDLVNQFNSIFFISPSVNYENYRTFLRSHTHLNMFGKNPVRFTYQLNPNTQFASHPVLELPPIDWSRSPLINSYITNMEVRQGVSSIFVANQRGQVSSIPLISTYAIANRRSAHVFFTGISQWLLGGLDQERLVMTELIENLVTWTSSPVDSGTFSLRTNQEEYSTNEMILFNAQLINDSGTSVSDAQIDISITNETINDSIIYTMQSSGIGLYTTTITPLPAGTYTYAGVARRGESIIGVQRGIFSVGNLQMELINTVRNDEILQSVSTLSGGTFITYEQFSSLNDILHEMEPVNTTRTSTRYVIAHSPFPYIIVLFLITAEWIIRRKYLLP